MSTQSKAGGTSSTLDPYAPSRSEEKRGVERLLGEFVASWNKHDPNQMASYFADDGDLITPWGRVARGRADVQQVFRDEHAGTMKTCTHRMTISSVRWAADDVAIVDADCELTGLRGPEGKELPMMTPHVFFVISRRDGDWKVLSARPYQFSAAPGA